VPPPTAKDARARPALPDTDTETRTGRKSGSKTPLWPVRVSSAILVYSSERPALCRAAHQEPRNLIMPVA
jgi:hypothetical protein